MRDRALTHLYFPGFPWARIFYFNLWNTQKEYTFLWSFLCYLRPRWPLVVARGVWTSLPCTNTAHLRFSAYPHSCLCVLIKCPLGLKKWRSLLSMLGHLRGERNIINSHAGHSRMHGYLLGTKYSEADVSCGPGDCLQSRPNKTREQRLERMEEPPATFTWLWGLNSGRRACKASAFAC